MSAPHAATPVLFFLGGGGFVWEAKSLWSGLPQSVNWAFVIPDDSVTPEWTRNGAIHKLPAFGLRGERSLLKSVSGFFRCGWGAYRLIRQIRPRLVICMGQAMAVPILATAKAVGARRIFIESITRTGELSRTGRIVAGLCLADLFLVQWPELVDERRGLKFEGTVL